MQSKKYFLILPLFILLICLPIVISLTQRQQEYRQSAASPTYPDPTNYDSPYGFTNIAISSQLLADYKTLGVHWIRYQVEVVNINWAKLDADVATLNAAGIHIDIPFHCFSVANGHQCFSNPYLPTTTEVSNFATQIATRYNGQNGHGFVDSFEVLNEEAGFYPPADYPPLLKAGYQAIKAASPHALVGMYGPFEPAGTHYHDVIDAIYAAGDGPYFDYANYHFYIHHADPANPPSGLPSFDQVWQTYKSVGTQYGYPNKPIWITEMGWPSTPQPDNPTLSPQVQAQYMQYVFDHARQSGIIQRIMWFTLDYGGNPSNQRDDIHPSSGYLPAFTTYKNYVSQYAVWNTNASITMSPTTPPTGNITTTNTPTPSVIVTQNPSPTIPPGSTTFTVTVCPHGLGNCGDNVTPGKGGNVNPLHVIRNATITILDMNNSPVGQPILLTVTYNLSSQTFQGIANAGTLATGQYLVTVKMDGFLSKQYPGIISVTKGQQSVLPEVELITGDINNDNQLDIQDYNMLLSCFMSKYTTASCPFPATSLSPGADIDDNGSVDGIDYNLFLRELSVQKGI